MNPQPKPIRWTSQKYIDHVKQLNSLAPMSRRDNRGQIVACHQNLGHGKMGGKVSDSQTLPLTSYEHSFATKPEHGGDKAFWRDINRARLCCSIFFDYIEMRYPFDPWREALEHVTRIAWERGWK